MARRKPLKHCHNCGDPVRGPGRLCKDCKPVDPAPTPKDPERPYHLAMCRFCKAEVLWENVGRLKRQFPDGQVEALYFCSSCGATLEFASWVQER